MNGIRTRVLGSLIGLGLIFGAAFAGGRLFEGDDVVDPGYSLQLSAGATGAGGSVPIRFTVLDGNQAPVTRFAVQHEKRLHLIAVRKDFAEFRHVHPVMAADGTWSVDAALPAGSWRVFADFVPEGGADQVLHSDLEVPGSAGGGRPAPAGSTSTVVDGFTVTVTGTFQAGGDGSVLELVVRDGDGPVTDLEPYLGAYGHLVVLRDDDLEYLHVHPEDGPAGPGIPFHVTVPAAGRYRLFLDFQHGGVVRTAAFTLDAAAAEGHDGSGGMDHGDH